MKLWTWDLEAFNWDQVCCAVLTSEDGDVERITGTPTQILATVAAIMEKAGGTFVAHYGGGYDTPLLLNVHRFKKIILTGSNILCAEDGPHLKVRDSYPWFLCSLAKLGDALGMKKGDVDRGNLQSLTMKEIVDYCEQDCRILLKGCQVAKNFLASYGARDAWTAGSSAMNITESLEEASWQALKRHALSIDDVRTVLQVVRGGRVECFARGKVEGVYVYDIKSSYPARYANDVLPIGARPAKPGEHECTVWRSRWTWNERRLIPPALDDATMTGVGACEAWLTAAEIDRFESLGVKVQRLEGLAPQMILPLGQLFAAEMYRAKESGGPESAFAKVWFNSFHGKLSEDPIKESFTRWRPDRYVGPEPEIAGSWWRYFEVNAQDGDWTMAREYAQPLAAATILGRARAAIFDIDHALQMAGWEVYYNDTDSVMTNCPPDRMPIPLGKNLGELAFEGGPYTGYFLGPKAYLLVDSDGKVSKQALKGVPLRSYANGILDAGVYREAQRPSPSLPKGETGSELRINLFERALSDTKGARCLKDGVTSFLKGLNGASTAGAPKEPQKWKRSQVIRDIRPSGRGKLFQIERGATAWAYLTTLELYALDLMRALPMSSTQWASKNLEAREFLVQSAYVSEYTLIPTTAGFDWLQKLGGGDLPPPIIPKDESDDYDDC